MKCQTSNVHFGFDLTHSKKVAGCGETCDIRHLELDYFNLESMALSRMRKQNDWNMLASGVGIQALMLQRLQARSQ